MGSRSPFSILVNQRHRCLVEPWCSVLRSKRGDSDRMASNQRLLSVISPRLRWCNHLRALPKPQDLNRKIQNRERTRSVGGIHCDNGLRWIHRWCLRRRAIWSCSLLQDGYKRNLFLGTAGLNPIKWVSPGNILVTPESRALSSSSACSVAE